MSAILALRLTGGASNADPNASLGTTISSEELSGTALNNIFDHVDEVEAAAGDTEYRILAYKNTGDESAKAIEFFFSQNTTNADTELDVALVSNGASCDDESTPPAGATFSHPLTGSRLSIPDLAPGSEQWICLRRTVQEAAGNSANDNAKFKIVYA